MNLDTQMFVRGTENPSEFPGTIWMEVTDQKKVIQRYWPALRLYLSCFLYRFPQYRGEAEDLMQEFILKKILQPGWLENARPEKGRFRDFLKSSLKNFVVGEIRNREAGKRGGDNPSIPLEDLERELAGPEPPSDSFDIAWLRSLLGEALARMERGCAVSDCTHIWEIFQSRLLRPSLEGVAPLSYEELIAKFGLKSPAQATNALASGKRMFARHLRDVIAQYETGDQAVRAELDALKLFLATLGQSAERKSASNSQAAVAA